MHPRINFGGELPIPHERLNLMGGGTWMPLTPEKQIPRSQAISQVQTEEWKELTGMYGAYIQQETPNLNGGAQKAYIQQETPNFNGGAQNFNPMGTVQNVGYYGGNGDAAERNRVINNIAGSYAQAFNPKTPSWSNNSTLANLLAMKNAAFMAQANRTHRGMNMVNAPLIPNLRSQADSNWRRPNTSIPALANVSTPALANVNRWSSSNQLGTCNSLSQMPQEGFPVPYRSNYNLNLPPRTETYATSSISNSVQFSAVTPDQARRFENSKLSAISNLLADEGTSKGKDHENFVTAVENEAIQHPCDELLQNIVDSSSTAISTPFKENKDSEKVSDRGIDLNKTPQQKAPKRRKIRPKVIVEGKPKRVPKSAGSENTESRQNPTAKRKYVRKNGLKESGSEHADILNSPTPPTPANIDCTQNTTGKRKYVRKKGVKEMAAQQADSANDADPNAGTATKSCRRGLNFDLEKSSDGDQGSTNGQEEAQQGMRSFNLNLASQTTELRAGTSSLFGTRLAAQISQQNRLTVKNHQPGTSNLTPSMENMLTNYISLQGRRAAGAPQASMSSLQIGNSNVSSRDIDVGNAEAWQKRSKCGYIPREQHIHAEGIGQIVFQAKANEQNSETTSQLMSQSRPQPVLNTFPRSNEARGSKREYQQILQQEYHTNSSNYGTGLSENHKKKKFENGLLQSIFGMPFAEAVQDSSRQANKEFINEVGANGFTTQINHGILNSYFKNHKFPKEPSSGVNNFARDLYVHSMAAGHNLPQQHTPELHSYTDRRGVTQVQNLASPTTIENHNASPPAPTKKASEPGKGQIKRTSQATASAKRQTAAPTLSNSALSRRGQDLQEQKGTLDGRSSVQLKGPQEELQQSILIDNIINRLKRLSLNETDNNMVGQEQKAMVIYEGGGAIVLHDIKKRKPRPKVDLDPETNRAWKFLMGNEGGDGIEGTDKEKWWEGEREVFRGRADSFIARMHLVQGDRRFSPWKGSVVDSVIGVFLTQNVSDHLSSSAFMALAARFPPNSTSNEARESHGKSILVEEPEDCIVNLDDSIKSLEKISCLPEYNPSSRIPEKLREKRGDSETSVIERTSLTEVLSQSIEEEVISSQGSYDSSIVQGSGGIRSYSGSNSEAEDPTNGCASKSAHGSSSNNFLEMEKSAVFQEFYCHVHGSSIFDERSNYQNQQPENIEHGQPRSRLQMGSLEGSAFTYPINSQDLQMRAPVAPSNNCLSRMTPDFGVQEYIDAFRDESTSPWSATSSGFSKATDANYTRNSIGHLAENVSKSNIQHSGLLRSQEMPTMGPFALSSRHPMQQQSISQTGSHSGYNQPFQNNYPSERNKSFQLENTSVKEPRQHAEALADWQKDTMPHVPKQTENTLDCEESISVVNDQVDRTNNLVKPKPKEQVHSSGKTTNEMNTKSKKVKAESQGKNAVDWDNLRREVQANGRRKERSQDKIDTMDYEAMRCAKVNEISDAIKERGMNHMLAERIKDFLNRLVREHGSIDLEWLRDVDPDKAKEYLLSIRGLGLKSVECVRLLTLHQLAFPVDTNVGRIAVRLGWVPLQPLPESLQLHLLEMYPMLESIQKYIWPRLCKLDQRTLYELHYQMITFGKVFCTKKNPNCNACPMKGECRHFASAFASARLALPGPEEKGIVSSTIPTAQERNPTVVIHPTPLLTKAGRDVGQCIPIIEEPATPEQERIEPSESDIEDLFDEDPDEIPTIKLNIETFTENLQKYMQENTELQECDMSKALVALNPEAAAIPTPKLKTVSRLRTEHQVYELPDSHPLLTGMDKRERDDPSPYLLAIWTPGETVDSIQPPEIRCSFQETGKLCNEETCFVCNSTRESNSQTVRGTILIPCRTAMRGSFPLNGTYFQVNEMFADHDSSVTPIDVPRAWIWNLPRRTVYFGTSVSAIFRGLSTEGIQYCFWRGFVCVRGFDQKTRAPRPLIRRLHNPASKLARR